MASKTKAGPSVPAGAPKRNPRTPASVPSTKHGAKPRNWSVRMLDLDYS